MVVGRPYAAANLVQSPTFVPGTASVALAGIAPIIPSASVLLTVPAGSLGIQGRPANLGNITFRPGLMVIGSQRSRSVALSDPAAVIVDDIDSSARTQYLRTSATINGHNFKAAQGSGTVKIGGVTQTIIAWSDTSIDIGPVDRGTLKYGDHDLTVANDDGRSATLLITLEPDSGWFYVNLDISNADVDALLPTNPALVASTDYVGWQISYGNFKPPGPGFAVVYADSTLSFGNGLASFEAEINDGSGWGATGLQEFNVDLTPDVVALSFTGYAPTILQSTNTQLAVIPTAALGLSGVAPTLVETTSRNFIIPAGALRFRGNKPQGRAMYGLGSGGLGTGGLGARDRTGLTAGIGVSENID